MARIQLHNIRVDRNLRDIPRAIQQRGLVAGAIAGAFWVVNRAKELAPVLTGTLRRSLHIGGRADLTPDFRSLPEHTELPGPERTHTRVKVFVGTNLEYAPYQEFGTSNMAAQPFLRPAMDENPSAVRKEIVDAIQDVIRDAIR